MACRRIRHGIRGLFVRKRFLSLLFCVPLLLGGGCTLIKGALQLPDSAIQTVLPFTQQGKAPDPVEIQSRLIRFADNYLNAVTRTMRKLQRNGRPIGRRELVRRRIQYTNDVLAITTGSNAFANLLDMIVLVTFTKTRVETSVAAHTQRADLDPIRKIFSESEREIWRISALALRPEQQSELRTALARWLQQNPDIRLTPDLSDLDFIAEIKQFNRTQGPAAPTSVFNLLMIDPLSGLDPAAKELAETRLMAERALFLSRHLPELIRWETEYMAMNALELPQVAKLLTDASSLSESADRLTHVTETLPGLIRGEREQWVAALKSERQGLTALAAEAAHALTAGKQMSDSAQATLQSFQAVIAKLNAKPPDPDSEPFRIGDYTAAAAQISQTAEHLTELLGMFGGTVDPDHIENVSARVELLSRAVEAKSKDVVDYAYRRALVGSALICAMALAAALAYQLLAAWFRGIAARRTWVRRQDSER